MLTGCKWIENKINKCLQDIDYHSKEMEKEIERCNQRTIWVKELKQSLKEVI